MDWTDFSKESFSFPGNYRAIVEDNDDPLDIGRVRVRIFGIHSLDPDETPVNHLPWAEPCLSMYYSGGQNLINKEEKDSSRYLPAKDVNNDNIPKRNLQAYDPDFVDNTMTRQGTGGIYGVPRKGSMVWVFFENQDHTRPQYWSLATKQRDWQEQKNHLIEEVQEKRNDINDLRSEFEPDNAAHTGSSCASNANVKVHTNIPKLEVFQIDTIKNYYITSHTSDLGVTSIIVNEPGKERMYLIHKGYMEFVDENGQRKVLVGSSQDEAETFNQGDAAQQNKLKNDREEMVANNYELHILGDFDIFVNSSTYIQCEKDVQINAKNNIGIVSRDADIDIVCDSADINMHTAGKTNINAEGDIQLHTSSNFVGKIDGDMNWNVGGKIEIKAATEIIFDAGVKYNVKAPTGFHVDAGGKFKVDPGGFGADVPMNAPVSNAVHTGCFPGPGAGPSVPYPAVPTPYVEIPFQPGTTSKNQMEQPPAIEVTDADGSIEDLEEIEVDTEVVVDTGGGEAAAPEPETPTEEPEEEFTEPEDDFDDRLENQQDEVDDAIANNQELATEAEELEQQLAQQEEVAAAQAEAYKAEQEALRAEQAAQAFDETGAANATELEAAAEECRQQAGEEC